MDPRIEYATTSDGFSIAYTTIGAGVPLVHIPPALPWSNIQEEWQIPEWRHYYDHLAETFRVVRYDNRGSGLSTRKISDFDLNTHLLDLEAVVNRLELERFALFGLYFSSQIAIAYAAAHPERVSHLILWCPVPHHEDNARAPAIDEALDRLAEIDYSMFTETLAHSVFGWEQGAAAHRLALYMQSSVTPETFRLMGDQKPDRDVRPLLPQIKAKTLVVHRRDHKLIDLDVSQRVAATIPGARLAVVPGETLSPYLEDVQTTVDLFNELVGIDGDAAGAHRQRHPHPQGSSESAVAFRTIMFTDMQESTAITQRLGDAGAQELIRLHNDVVEQALFRHHGKRVKHTGDGIMASFPTASGAVECAIDIQRAFADRNDADPTTPVSVRIGINAGEPVAEGDDLFGTAVQLASRVCAQAEAGEILTTDVVRQLVAGKAFLFSDKGTAELRGFEELIRIFEVSWTQSL
jgi:class 3 adenylate cyclase/pimeloyl-ACP methyl ester carboxylesterase